MDRIRPLYMGLVAALATTPGIAGSAEPPLFPDPVMLAPDRPLSMAEADFNEDGHADLVVGGDYSDYLSVFLGRGDGAFEEHRIDAPTSWAVAVGDFNGDGHQDLVASGNGDAVEVRLGNGDGTFGTPHVTEPLLDLTRRIEVADIDADGRDDLLVSFGHIRGGAILLGNGDGTFGSPLGGGYLSKLGDFDEDGYLDLVTPYDGSVGVKLGNGDGTFDCCISFAVPGEAYELLVNDFDGDGHLDISGESAGMSSEEPFDLWVVYGSGTGAFEDEGHYPVAPGVYSLVFADVNGDGSGDLVVGHQYRKHVSVLYGTAPRAFDLPLEVPTASNGGPIIVRDFDEDNARDLAVAASEGDTLFVLRGRPDGTFQPVGRRDFGVGESAFAGLAIGDIDLDQHLDVAAVGGGMVSVLLGDGSGDLESPIVVAAGTSQSQVAIGRLDGDILPDLAVLNRDSEDVALLLGQGFGNFVPGLQLPLDPSPSWFVFEDLDGDGLSDLATVHLEPMNAAVVRINHGDGTFSAPRAHPVGDSPRAIAVARLDDDAYEDLVVANLGSDDVSILRGEIGGSFGPEERFPAGDGPRRLAVGDVDGDGQPDIVAFGVYGSNVVLPGLGDGTFAPPIPLGLPMVLSAQEVNLSDLDGDGRLDIAWHFYSKHMIVVALGRGGFSFGPPMEYGAAFVLAAATGDLDEDGRPDLVTAASDRVSVHVNRGPRELSFARDGVTLGWPLDDDAASFEIYRGGISELADADQDGLPDEGYGVCLGETDAAHNEWTEPAVPAIDGGYFYLVSTVDPFGVRDLGITSGGHPRQPAEICP